jgi:hypothetical protein
MKTVGVPFPVQLICSLWPPRSTSFPGGFGAGDAARVEIAKTKQITPERQKRSNVFIMKRNTNCLALWFRNCAPSLAALRFRVTRLTP